MNVGRAITEAMRDQRYDDLRTMAWRPRQWGMSDKDGDRMKAYFWWGWNVSGNGGVGRPGAHWPHWYEERRERKRAARPIEPFVLSPDHREALRQALKR